jgi:hypothetical protein
MITILHEADWDTWLRGSYDEGRVAAALPGRADDGARAGVPDAESCRMSEAIDPLR